MSIAVFMAYFKHQKVAGKFLFLHEDDQCMSYEVGNSYTVLCRSATARKPGALSPHIPFSLKAGRRPAKGMMSGCQKGCPLRVPGDCAKIYPSELVGLEA
jgi:hypothetical protein